ncbi:MAG: purple acid phosphatase family protein [Planctomycetota bacterium]|jgi:hypothetical protein
MYALKEIVRGKKCFLFITLAVLLLLVSSHNLYAENSIDLIQIDDATIEAPVASLRKGPYLIYPNDNTKMTIHWQLWESARCVLRWGQDMSFPDGVETFESGSGDNQHQHSYTISNLIPGTQYFYRITADGFAGINTGSFWTAPSPNETKLKFMVYGDSRSQPAIHNVVAGAMVATYEADPDYHTLVLSTGDLVAEGNNEADWDDHLLGTDQQNIRDMLANLPFHAAMGNHEMPGDLFEKYLPYPFAAPRYWSFDYGPAHFVVIDQYTDYGPGSAQLAWLENDLAATTQQWKFVYFHEPGWSAGAHPNNPLVQYFLQPLFKQYGVTMVFTGHNHYYARAVVGGVHHITTGGGGAPLYLPNPNSPLVVETSMTNHYCTVEIDGDSLTFTALEPDGTVLDSFHILVSAGSIWKYLDNGVDQGTAWREVSFNDGTWPSGAAQLGYGDGDESTIIDYGADPTNKYPSYYFRHSFNVADASKYESLRLKVIRDDGIVVYLNGAEVFRNNMPDGLISYGTWATSAVGGDDESKWYETNIDASYLVNGKNVIAVEVHQADPASSDVSFDLQLIAEADPLPDIKVNDQDGLFFVTPDETVDLTISLDPGSKEGELCELWIIILNPPAEPVFIPGGQISLFDLPEIPLASGTLPKGVYSFIFVLDYTPDGVFTPTWLDYVVLVSQ